MKRRQEIDDELGRIAPGLADLERGSAFKVPDGYFDGLADEVLRKVKVETEAKPAVQHEAKPSWLDVLAQQLAALLQPRMAVGLASAALLIAAAFWIWPQQTDKVATEVIAEAPQELSADELNNYIASNLDEFDTELLYVMSMPDAENSKDGMLNNIELDEQTIDDILEDMDVGDLNELL